MIFDPYLALGNGPLHYPPSTPVPEADVPCEALPDDLLEEPDDDATYFGSSGYATVRQDHAG